MRMPTQQAEQTYGPEGGHDNNSPENPAVWFQPIVDTANSRVFAYQCLFANAAPKETQIALRGIAAMRRSGIYFVDVSAASPPPVAQSNLARPHSIVCQLRLSDPGRQLHYLRRLKEIYSQDKCDLALVAHDADSETLHALAELQPAYIKLHQGLSRNVESPRCAEAIRKITELADRHNLVVIAEGVRASVTLENLWLVGVRNMQGDLFGQPAMSIFSKPPDFSDPSDFPQNAHRRLVKPV